MQFLCNLSKIIPGQKTAGIILHSPWTIATWIIAPRQLLPRTISPWTIPTQDNFPLDNSHLGLLRCHQIITPRQLLPRAMTITNYTFSMAIFCFCFFLLNYIISVFCYDNKNNNANSNKTWSFKLLSDMILQH